MGGYFLKILIVREARMLEKLGFGKDYFDGLGASSLRTRAQVLPPGVVVVARVAAGRSLEVDRALL